MTWRRVLRYGLFGLATTFLLAALLGSSVWFYFHPRFEWQRGVVYGSRRGQSLTLDVVRPARPNGLGVALMVSGGWKSGTNSFHPWMATRTPWSRWINRSVSRPRPEPWDGQSNSWCIPAVNTAG